MFSQDLSLRFRYDWGVVIQILQVTPQNQRAGMVTCQGVCIPQLSTSALRLTDDIFSVSDEQLLTCSAEITHHLAELKMDKTNTTVCAHDSDGNNGGP